MVKLLVSSGVRIFVLLLLRIINCGYSLDEPGHCSDRNLANNKNNNNNNNNNNKLLLLKPLNI